MRDLSTKRLGWHVVGATSPASKFQGAASNEFGEQASGLVAR